MMFSGTPSRASSSACVWRSWCGANRRLTRRERRAGGTRSGPQRAITVARGRAVDDAEPRAARQLEAGGQPRAQLLPAPLVHPDLAPAAALALAHKDRSAPVVEV